MRLGIILITLKELELNSIKGGLAKTSGGSILVSRLEKEVAKAGNLITKEKLLELIKKSTNKTFNLATDGKVSVVVVK